MLQTMIAVILIVISFFLFFAFKKSDLLFPTLHTLFTITVFLVSFIGNFGLIRLLFILPIFAHLIVFIAANVSYYPFYKKHTAPARLNALLNISFMTGYLFLPETDEVYSYALFGLIKENTDIAYIISGIFLTLNVILLIWQFIHNILTGRRASDKEVLKEPSD